MASGISYVHPDKPLAPFINEGGISGKYHRQGLGRRLVARLLDEGRRIGCHEAWVATELNNTAARALYKSLGGVPDEEHAIVYVYKFNAMQGGAKSDAQPGGQSDPRRQFDRRTYSREPMF